MTSLPGDPQGSLAHSRCSEKVGSFPSLSLAFSDLLLVGTPVTFRICRGHLTPCLPTLRISNVIRVHGHP